MEGKRGQFEFSWIFAIIVGAVILFLTFFFLGKEIFLQETKTTIEQTRGFDLLLGPFSYLGAIAEASTNEIIFSSKTNLSFDCNSENLGYDIMTINAKQQSIDYEIYDKYIFARDIETSKFDVLSMPVEIPFRIADAIILIPEGDEKYCFVNAPTDIQDELHDLNLSFEFFRTESMCPVNSIKICFDSSGCDIKVYDKSNGNYDYGQVIHGSDNMFFAGRALLYSAIFSSQKVYRCNVKRLMNRLEILSKIYSDKSNSMAQKGCDNNYAAALNELKNAARSVSSNINTASVNSIKVLYEKALRIEQMNDYSDCSLY